MRYITLLLAVIVVGALPVRAQDEPDPLADYNTTPSQALFELEQRGVVPSGSTFVFVQEGSTLVGGSQFVTFVTETAADTELAPNFVFGGTLQLTSADDDTLEGCALVARADIETGTEATDEEITEFASINAFVDVGITNDGEVYVLDRVGPDDDDVTLTTYEAPFDPGDEVTLTTVMLDDALMVYANGVLVAEAVEVEAAPADDYAFALNAADAATSCAGSDFWLYTLPEGYVSGQCEITAERNINQRRGPGLTFDVVRQLESTETAIATGQAVDVEGFTWWQLEDETWVREDVVTALGACRPLPEIAF